VMKVDEFLAGLAASGQQRPSKGDTVVGSDRGEIGEVTEVVAGDGGEPGYLLVKRGLVFDRETYIPLDAVTHRTDGRVYINVPKLVVGKLPWSKPPSTAAAREKFGPPRAAVEMLYGSFNPTGAAGR
jgi:ureidoacrylate peracid hydrolase